VLQKEDPHSRGLAEGNLFYDETVRELPGYLSMKKLSLSRNQIKYIAVLAMLIDHIALFFLSPQAGGAPLAQTALYFAMRMIGRLTGPIMIFFLTEGFIHTSSRRNYGIRLLLFGLLSQIPYALAHHNTIFVMDFNMILTLFLIFLMLEAAERIEDPILNHLAVFALIMGTFCCDWGVIGPLMAWLFYKDRKDRKEQIKDFAVVSIIQIISVIFVLSEKGYPWYEELWQIGLFLVIPFLFWYNGSPGRKTLFSRYFFYIIYPLHLLLIWYLKYVL
jgi:hypothetical protein